MRLGAQLGCKVCPYGRTARRLSAQNEFCLVWGLRFRGRCPHLQETEFLDFLSKGKVNLYGENRKAVMCAKQVLLSVGLRFVGSAHARKKLSFLTSC